MEISIKFLKLLAKNNSKIWFDENRKTYELAKQEFELLLKPIIDKVIIFDKSLAGIEAKKCMFRINRDVRFSKNKAPYKLNMGASINPNGKKDMGAGYYLHIEPNNSFLAGGCYMPPPEALASIRQEIDYNAVDLKSIINHKDFKTYFTQLSQDDKLKTAPRDYDKTHPEIALLQHKHFIVVHKISDAILLDKNFTSYAAKVFKAMYPLNLFLRNCIEQ